MFAIGADRPSASSPSRTELAPQHIGNTFAIAAGLASLLALGCSTPAHCTDRAPDERGRLHLSFSAWTEDPSRLVVND